MTPARLAILMSAPRTSLDLQFLFGTVDSRITVSGGANASVTNSSGVLAAATAPRLDYHPVTLAPLGLLMEVSSTNVLLNSKLDGTNLSTQSVTTTAQAYTLSFYGTGTVTLSGAFAGSLVGSGAYPTRSTLTFTSTAASLTLTVSGTVQYAQLEAGSFATSFIPTAGTAVTRTADAESMTGVNFSSWFNAAQGTFVAEFDVLATSSAAGMAPVSADNGSANGYLFYKAASDVKFYTYAGTNNAQVGSLSANTIAKAALSYGGNGYFGTLNGATPSSIALNSVQTPTQLLLGKSFGGNQLSGHLRRVRYWPRQLQGSSLQNLTT